MIRDWNIRRVRTCTAALAVFVAAALVLIAVPAGAAAPPLRVTEQVDETFRAPVLSRTCGVPVFIHIEGTASVLLFYDSSGTQVVRELDTWPGFTFTIFSPTEAGGTGKSFTFPFAEAVHYDYSSGTSVGSDVIVTITGLQEVAVPGVVGAGREVDRGVVVGASAEGIPFVDFVSNISATGSFERTGSIDPVAARCALLTDA